MRVAGLLVLALLLPAFAQAALININTADAELLDTLPDIGPTKANAIIDYRNQFGLFVQIEDIKNVSGIGDVIYAKISSLITVEDVVEIPPPDESSPEVSSNNETSQPSGGGVAEYLLRPELHILGVTDRTVSANAEVTFTASVYDGKGNKRDDALVTWSFGDGMKRTGASVLHKYYESGEYLAVVHATTSDDGDASLEIVITVKDADIAISAVSAKGISLTNSGSRTLDLSLWRLSMGGKEFQIPSDTFLLGGHTTLFPAPVIDLPFSSSAQLLYPSGEVADTFPKIAATAKVSLTKPVTTNASYQSVQKVDNITSPENIQTYEETVSAPAEATTLAAVGAVSSEGFDTPSTGLLHSPWFFTFVGVVTLAAGAFVFI